MRHGTEARRIDYGSMWGFMRSVLTQGAAIYQDFAAGSLKDYEEYSARVDAAARERDDELKSLPSATAPTTELRDALQAFLCLRTDSREFVAKFTAATIRAQSALNSSDRSSQ